MDDRSARAAFGSHVTVLRDVRFAPVLLIATIGVLGTGVVSPALPSIAAALSVSDARVGLLMTAFTLPAIVMIPVAGMVADLVGRRGVLLASLFLYGSAGTAIAFVDSFSAVLVLRAVQGIGYSGTMPLTITLAGDLYQGSRGSTAQGMLSSAKGIGNIVAPVVAGVLLGIAWYYPFLLFALAFPTMLLVYVYFPEPVDRRRTGSLGDLWTDLRGYWVTIGRETGDRTLAILYTGALVEYFVKYGVLTFVPLFAVRAFAIDEFALGLLLAVYGVVRILVSPLVGLVVAWSSRKVAIVATIVVVGVGVGGIPVAPSVLWLAVAISVYSVGDSLLSPLLNDTVTEIVADHHRGGVVSGMNTLKNVGKTLAPVILGGALAVQGFGLAFGIAAVAIVVVGVGSWLVLDVE